MSAFQALKNSSKDIRILWLSAFLRLLAFSSSNIVLSLFLKALEINETSIGIFMTCTLIGDTVLSYLLTWYADGIGRKFIMIVGSILMIISGLIFANFENFSVLLVAAVFGVISPSGDEVGPFKSIEESTMAHLTPLRQRPDVYALHWVLGTAGSALGSLITGFLVSYLTKKPNWKQIDAYRTVFYIYSIVGVLKLVLICCLSDRSDKLLHEQDFEDAVNTDESRRLLPNNDIQRDDPLETDNVISVINKDSQSSKSLSKETVSILVRLCTIFMMDSFGSGFMSSAWVVYYYKTILLVSSAALGILFFVTNICNSISALPSSILAKTLGPIKATLVVQVPSAIFLIITPLMGSFLSSAIFTVLFYSTSAMDVVPRQVLLTGLIKSEELTKCMGIVNIGKTLARCVGPIVTGNLAEKGYLWISFLISGSFILFADFLLFVMFYGLDEKILHMHR
ncbi:hypothetical protein WICMUC_004413 [Wickerhamomyces mucosus]|uniref:Major facilitator superfamily (MFS) profile domain-containing protein n=1 Tax=Wickerhamomyces mucosus TaxID=1378264 RepID=A0A9P8TB11_9ASCO|nr:hypothetical protein WICMUC_004413 [Wickerhamomyces mucosus]